MNPKKTIPIFFSIGAAVFSAFLFCLADELTPEKDGLNDAETRSSISNELSASILEAEAEKSAISEQPVLEAVVAIKAEVSKQIHAVEAPSTTTLIDDMVPETVSSENSFNTPHQIEEPDITEALVKMGTWGRPYTREMKPQFITIHSTQNWNAIANAEGHAKLLQDGGKRGVAWHFTVDESSIFQSLPASEQGRHSDFGGKGDKTSIGIEMCENWGNSKEETLARTCHLVAWLMKTHNIPISNVVPHYHWRAYHPRRGYLMDGKPCPHFFMDPKKGVPNEKWHAFLDQIEIAYLGKEEFIAKRAAEKETAEKKQVIAEVTAEQMNFAKVESMFEQENEKPLPVDGPWTLQGVIFEDQGVGFKDTSVRLKGARVRIVQTGKETKTSAHGAWSFKVAPGRYTVEVIHHGYESASRDCEVKEDNETWASMGVLPANTVVDLFGSTKSSSESTSAEVAQKDSLKPREGL